MTIANEHIFHGTCAKSANIEALDLNKLVTAHTLSIEESSIARGKVCYLRSYDEFIDKDHTSKLNDGMLL
jgi:hypothetical protein